MRTPATVGTTSSSPSALSLWTATKNVPTLLFPITAPSAPSPPTISKVVVDGGSGDVTTRLSSLDRYDLARRASLNRHLRTIEQPNVIVQISPRHRTQLTLDARQTASRPNTASAPPPPPTSASASAMTSASLALPSSSVNVSPALVPGATQTSVEERKSSLPLPSLNIDNIDRSEQQLTTDERKLLIYDSAYQARQKVLRRALEALEQKRIEKQQQKQQEDMAEQIKMQTQAAANELLHKTLSEKPVSDDRTVETKSFDSSPNTSSDAPLPLSLPTAVVNAINNTLNNDATPNSSRMHYGSLSARTSEKSRPRKEMVSRRLSIQTMTPVKSATERRPSFPQHYSSRAPTASAATAAPTSRRQSDLVTERAMERLRQQRDAQKRAELDKAKRLAEAERLKEEERERRRHLAHAASMAEQKRQQRLVQQKEAELRSAEEARHERAATLLAKQQQRYAEDDRRRKAEDTARQEAEAERQRAEEYRQQSAAAAAERRRTELLQRAAELKRSEEDNVTSRQYSSHLVQNGLYVVYDPSQQQQQQQHGHVQLIDGHNMSNIQ